MLRFVPLALCFVLPLPGCAAAATPPAAAPATLVSARTPADPVAAPIPLAPVRPRPAEPAPVGAPTGAIGKLASTMREDLGGLLRPLDPAMTHAALSAAQGMASRASLDLSALQTILVVDRSPKIQRLWVVAAGGGHPWEALGNVNVSTGKPGRKEHFRTPVGVFTNGANILGYRALGTYNENHIRGNGLKGMRVWDFGWQTTDDWRTRGAVMAVRMEMHATDPANLESRLGVWDSEGCIRIHSKVNSFIDRQGLIDAKLREAAATDRRFAALLPRETPSPIAGSTVIVVDTSDPSAPVSDPARAYAIEHPVLPPSATPEAPPPVPPSAHEDAG